MGSELVFALPAPLAVQDRFAGHPLAEFASLDASACRALLQERWSGLTFSPARALAEYFRSLPSLNLCASDEKYWLQASDGIVRLGIETSQPQALPSLPFPVDSIPGLREFLTYFGGFTNWGSAPGSRWMKTADLQIVEQKDADTCWGMVEAWHGSLVVYQGLSGDAVVLHPSGRAGKWRHEFAFSASVKERSLAQLEQSTLSPRRRRALAQPKNRRERFIETEMKRNRERWAKHFDQPAIVDLNKSFTALVESYVDICKIELGKAEDETFYY